MSNYHCHKSKARSRSNVLKILVCYHKVYTLPPDNEIFLPVHAGAAVSNQKLNIQADDKINGRTCDNISAKNENYCELTVMYWAWKNLKKLYPDVKYVGLFHYRRFLEFNEDKIISALENGKIVVAKKRIFKYSLAVQYCIYHISDDYRTLLRIIQDKFSDYYDSFISVMENSNKIFLRNMFIMKYDDFVKYCEWLFKVLSEIEAAVPFQNYSPYQKRVFGYMAERLMNVYIHKHKMKTEECRIYHYPDTIKKKNMLMRLRNFFRDCNINLAFWLMKPKLQWLEALIRHL